MTTTMNYKKRTLFRYFAIFFAILVFQSCQKDDVDPKEDNATISTEAQIEMVENSTFATNLITEDLNLILMGAEAQGKPAAKPSTCAVFTWNVTTNTLTIDFGTGCVGPYGRERSGKVIVTFVGKVGPKTADKIITFDHYVVNNVGISGEIKVGKFTENTNGFLESSITLIGYTHTYPNGNKLTINGTRTREWTSGVLDHDFSNNVFRLTGGISGVSTTGRSFTHNIIEPIISDFNCRTNGGFLRVEGVKEFLYEGIMTDYSRKVIYGDGNCDNMYTIIINDKEYTITKD